MFRGGGAWSGIPPPPLVILQWSTPLDESLVSTIRNVSEYIYSSNLLKQRFIVLVLYLNASLLCYFPLLIPFYFGYNCYNFILHNTHFKASLLFILYINCICFINEPIEQYIRNQTHQQLPR